MLNQGYLIFNKFESPPSLFEYSSRFLLRKIHQVKVDDQIKRTLELQSFCYDIYKDINNFYIEDWSLEAVLLNEDDYEVAALVIAKKSFIQNCYYRLAIATLPPFQILEVTSNKNHWLFKSGQINKYEYATLLKLYSLRIRQIDRSFHPSNLIKLEAHIDEIRQTVYLNRDALTFAKAYIKGPRALFTYGQQILNKSSFANLVNDHKISHAFLNKYPEFEQEYQTTITQGHWLLESVVLDKHLAISYFVLTLQEDYKWHLLTNEVGQPLEMFYEPLIYTNSPTEKQFPLIKKINEQYLNYLTKPKAIINDTPIKSIKSYDQSLYDLENLYALFTNKTILVIGPSFISHQDMEAIGLSMGVPKGTIRHDYGDYQKLTNTNLDYLKRNASQYVGIILGPMPHKMASVGKHTSYIQKIKSEPGFPFAIEAVSNSLGKHLKITKMNFMSSLSAILSYYFDLIK